MFVNGEVIKLNDKNFEHLTQASTGMTTGSWLVLFTAKSFDNKDCLNCHEIMNEFIRLSEDDEINEFGIVLGSVNIDLTTTTTSTKEHSETTQRFNIRKFPSLIYLHHEKLHRYDFDDDKEDMYTYNHMKKYVLYGKWHTSNTVGEVIPKPLSIFHKHIMMMQDGSYPTNTLILVGGCFVAVIIIAAILIGFGTYAKGNNVKKDK